MRFKFIIIAFSLVSISAYSQTTIPTIPIDPRCGQIFCPNIVPTNPCATNPALCKAIEPVQPVQPIQPINKCWLPEGCPPVNKQDEFKCMNGLRYQKIKTPDGMWVWKPVLWPTGEPVKCEAR